MDAAVAKAGSKVRREGRRSILRRNAAMVVVARRERKERAREGPIGGHSGLRLGQA
jgi:hypothetical protein